MNVTLQRFNQSRRFYTPFPPYLVLQSTRHAVVYSRTRTLLGLAGTRICPKMGAGSKTSPDLQCGARRVEGLVSGSALALPGWSRSTWVTFKTRFCSVRDSRNWLCCAGPAPLPALGPSKVFQLSRTSAALAPAPLMCCASRLPSNFQTCFCSSDCSRKNVGEQCFCLAASFDGPRSAQAGG